MAKTSAQLYQDINAIDSSDRDLAVRQDMMKNLALSAANAAAGLESITLFHGGPTVTPTAASLYTVIDAIDAEDKDPVIMQMLIKEVALLMAKIAMQIEAIRTGIGPQLFSYTGETSIGAASSISFGPNSFIRELSADISTTSSILTV